MEYVFGVRANCDNKLIINTAKIKKERNSSLNDIKLIDLLKNAMDYNGYVKFSNSNEFISEDCSKKKEDIIKELSNCPLLKYDKKFEKFVSTYLWCFGKIDGYEKGEIIYVLPKILWFRHIYEESRHTDIKVSEFLESLNFHKQEEPNKFILDEDVLFDIETIKNNLDSFEFLEYNDEFERMMN